MKDDVKADFEKKYPRPENATKMDTVTTNGLVWGKLDPSHRAMDSKLQHIQGFMLKGMTAVASSIDKLLDKADTDREILDHLVDAIALVGQAHFELCLRRVCFVHFATVCHKKAMDGKYKPASGKRLSSSAHQVEEEYPPEADESYSHLVSTVEEEECRQWLVE